MTACYVMQGTDKKMPLNSIRNELIEAGEDLRDVTTQQADCINMLNDCLPLVKWLKDNTMGKSTAYCSCKNCCQCQYH